ncbi:hypothetical protein KUTeg_015541, partial [Tegillarca granosa]
MHLQSNSNKIIHITKFDSALFFCKSKRNQQLKYWKTLKKLLKPFCDKALIFFFYYFPNDWKHRLLYSLPLLLFPLLIWCIKKILHWYFVKHLALNELREKKKKILEDVMETETYKKAKEILEKFDPNRFKQLEAPAAPATPKISPPGSELRRRPVQQGSVRTPVPPQRGVTPQQMRAGTPAVRPGTTPHIPRSGRRTPGPPLPRPVLPRERTKTDRLLEYLVGDGPQNRYALICKACHSHNGMALKEELHKKSKSQDENESSEDENENEDNDMDDRAENGESSESINSNNDIEPMDTDDTQE